MNEQDIETVVLEEDYIKKTFKPFRTPEERRRPDVEDDEEQGGAKQD